MEDGVSFPDGTEDSFVIFKSILSNQKNYYKKFNFYTKNKIKMDLLQEIIQNGNYTKLEDEYKIKMNVSSEYKFYIYNQLVLDYINAPRNIEPSTSEGIRQGSIGYFEKCKIINYCIEGIKKNIINPNNLIIGAIDECDSISALPLMAIAMRYGADINGYITVSGKGSFHILAYTIMKLKGQIDDNIVLIVLLMFSIMGANTNLEFRKNNRKINTNSIPYEETLSRFLIENGYPDFENVYDYIYNNTEDSVRKQIGVLLMGFLFSVSFGSKFGDYYIADRLNSQKQDKTNK